MDKMKMKMKMDKNKRKLLAGIAALPLIGLVGVAEAEELMATRWSRELTIDAAPGLSWTEIPPGVIEELYTNYNSVKWALDEKICEATHSRKCHYYDESTVLETHRVIVEGKAKKVGNDYEYEYTEVQGYVRNHYIVRVEHTTSMSDIIVRRVLRAGTTITRA